MKKINWKEIKRKIIDFLILVFSLILMVAMPWALTALVLKIAYLLFGMAGIWFVAGLCIIIITIWFLFAIED